ncbi:hypothetical protein ES703_01333 [subsurface metagenome]
MEFPFRSAVVSTFAHATEAEELVLDALRILLPEEIEVRRSRLKGHHGNPIVNLEARIERKKTRELWQRILAKLRGGESEKIARAAPGRIDETCHLHLRFDKQLAYTGELALAEGGDVIHLRLKVAAYPAKREVAVDLVEKFLQTK